MSYPTGIGSIYSRFDMKAKIHVDFFIKLFLFISIMLPAGTIFEINVKMISLGLLLTVFLVKSNGVSIVRLITFMLPSLIFLSFFILYAATTSINNEYMVSQAKDIFVFILMASVAYAFVEPIRVESVITNTIINIMCAVAVIKVMLTAMAFATGVPVSSLVQHIADLFKIQIMTLDVEDASLGRINFPSDSVLPIAAFFTACKVFNTGTTRKDYIKFGLVYFSLLISMSRYQWAASLISLMLAMGCYITKKKSAASIAIMFVAAISVISIPSVNSMIMERFNDRQTFASDRTRQIQSDYLNDKIDDKPMMGHGLGYYIPGKTRSTVTPYAYELQIPALVMQVGIVGASIIFLLIVTPILMALRGVKTKFQISIVIITILWLASGFFNPALFSSSGGAAFLLLYALGKTRSLNWEKVAKE